MSSRPTTPAHKSSRVAEAVQIAPYLTHIVRHHGQLTLIPPESEGRIRKDKGSRIAHNKSKSHSNLQALSSNATQSSTGRSRALSGRPSSTSLIARRPELNGSLRSHSENNVAIANPGTSSRQNGNFSPRAVGTIPDFPPPTFEEAVAILRATTTSGETTRIDGPSGSLAGRDALVGPAASSSTLPGSPPTIDVEIASDSDSSSSSLFVVEAPSTGSVRAQEWEEDRINGVFTLEQRVRRELERRSRQDRLSSSAEESSSEGRSKGKEDRCSGGGKGGSLQSGSRKGKERTTSETSCPNLSSSSLAHDWLFVDISDSSHSTIRYDGSPRITTDATSGRSGLVSGLETYLDDPPLHALGNLRDIPASSLTLDEAGPSWRNFIDTESNSDLRSAPPSAHTRRDSKTCEYIHDESHSRPFSSTSLSGYTSRKLPDASTSLENIIPNAPPHLTNRQSELQLHDQDNYTSCIHGPGTSSKNTETTPVSSHTEDEHSHHKSHTMSSTGDQLLSLDEGSIDVLNLSRLTVHPTSPSPLGSSGLANQTSRAIERSDEAVANRSAAPNSLSLSLTNRPLPCLPPALPRPNRQPPIPPTKLPAASDGSVEASHPFIATSAPLLASGSRPRRNLPPPPPPRHPRILSEAFESHENSGYSSIDHVSDDMSVMLSPQPPESAGSHELFVRPEHSSGNSSAAELTAAAPEAHAMESTSNNCSSGAQGRLVSVSIEDNASRETLDAPGSAFPATVNGPATILSTEIGDVIAADVDATQDAGPTRSPRFPEGLTSVVGEDAGVFAGPSLLPQSDAPFEPAEEIPPVLSEFTELDQLLSLLDDETRATDGSLYNDLLDLGDILGPAQALATTGGSGSTATTIDDLGNVFLGKVALDRRRVTKDGRTKLKLSLFGVVVDKCTICLTQFKENAWACLLPCQHAFHEKCCRRWLLRSVSCPLCRSVIT